MKQLTLLAILFALPLMAQAPNQERTLAQAVIYKQAVTIESLLGQIDSLQQQLAAAKSEATKCKPDVTNK